jgi:hypothetical protein
MTWCRQALLDLMKQWGLHLIVVLVVIGGGSSSGTLENLYTAATWLVWPLLRASCGPWWLPAVLAQALAAGCVLWLIRHLLWPQRWAEAERALPLPMGVTARSDAVVVLMGILPLLLLWALGAFNVFRHPPGWLDASRAIAALLCAAVGSVALGVAGLQALRRSEGHAVRKTGRSVLASNADSATWHRLRVLLLWPLWRGPAKGTGQILVAGVVFLLVPACGMAWRPVDAGWWLAAFAALALLVCGGAGALSRVELAALWDACAPLPVRRSYLHLARATVVATAVLPGGIALLVALPWSHARLTVFTMYWFVSAVVCAVELLVDPDPTWRAARWPFCVVLTTALGTEVFR